jgi:hypothetical protein
MRFSFAKRGFLCSGVYDARHDGNGATHPKFIETGATHVVRIVRSRIKAKAFTWGTKCPAGVAVEKLEDSAVLVETVIENRSDATARPIDHILLGILVQFLCENRSRRGHEHCSSLSLKETISSRTSQDRRKILLLLKDLWGGPRDLRRMTCFTNRYFLKRCEKSVFVLEQQRRGQSTCKSLTAKLKQLVPFFEDEL